LYFFDLDEKKASIREEKYKSGTRTSPRRGEEWQRKSNNEIKKNPPETDISDATTFFGGRKKKVHTKNLTAKKRRGWGL